MLPVCGTVCHHPLTPLCRIPAFVLHTCACMPMCTHVCSPPPVCKALSIPMRERDRSNLVIIISGNLISFAYVFKCLGTPYVHCAAAQVKLRGMWDFMLVCQTQSKMSPGLKKTLLPCAFPPSSISLTVAETVASLTAPTGPWANGMYGGLVCWRKPFHSWVNLSRTPHHR